MSARSRSDANVFAGLALDRASERRDDEAFLQAQAADPDARFLLMLDDERFAVERSPAGGIAWFAGADLPAQPQEHIFLGLAAGRPHFAVIHPLSALEGVIDSQRHAWVDLRTAALSLDRFDGGLAAYARGLAYWHRRHRHCSVCGQPSLSAAGGHRRRCSAPGCAADHFPRTDPAIIVIVTWRDACLLGRQESWPAKRYSTLAGFVEPGETLEDAVAREVFEEAGVVVRDCEYHSSQPWPFPASLMLGFTAEAASPDIRIGAELSDARWFELDELVSATRTGELLLPARLSVSYRLVSHWLERVGGPPIDTLRPSQPD